MLRSPLARLNSRRIVHWGVAYLAGAWLILQVLDLLAQPEPTFDPFRGDPRMRSLLERAGLR